MNLISNKRKETFESLMPIINPNLDEVVIEGKNEPLISQPLKDKNTTDIFLTKKEKLPKGGNTGKLKNKNTLENISAEGKEENVVITENKEDLPPAEKRTYPHLAKAREKAMINRQAKKKEKDRLKAINDERKLNIKAEKAEARKIKNREANRENYHKKKNLKKEEDKIIEKIEKIENVEVKEKVEKAVSEGMTYKQFSMFMTMYDRDKKLMEAEDNKKIKEKEKINKKEEADVWKESIVSNHPPNYYNPNQSRNYRRNANDLFN